jgi:FkbM family methyltransferase
MELYNEINNVLKYKNIGISEKVNNLINNKSIYLIGKNTESYNISKILNITGIIDDYSELTDWNGIKIFKLKIIERDVLIINCSTSISPVSVKKYLISNGFVNVIDYFELSIYDEKFVKPKFSIDTFDDFYKNYSKWSNLYNIIKDDESKQVLKDVLLFRLTSDPMYMQNYKVRLDEQYMEDFMEYSEEIMVDAGAFDGETTEIFCKKYKNYKEIHLFEPAEVNFQKSINRLNNFDNINFYKMGLSNKDEVLFFNDVLESSSKISTDGNTQIRVIKLDDVIKKNISFLKMDIEGFEMPALMGSFNHIKNNHPKLAIAVYHNPEDFWKITEYILNIREDYDVYIRHYTEGWSETIMYFKPKNDK